MHYIIQQKPCTITYSTVSFTMIALYRMCMTALYRMQYRCACNTPLNSDV